MKLKDTQIKNVKPSEKPRKLFDGKGLYLEVQPNGAKYWRLKYRINGYEKRLAIGVYPEISLKEARKATNQARELIDAGHDPSLAKKRKKALSKINTANTFEAVALEWYENRKSRWSPNYAAGVIRRLEVDVFPDLGQYPIKDIDPPLILATIRKIENRNARELAKRQLQKCGEIFQYAIATGRLKNDPTYSLSKALKPAIKSHYSAINFSELPEFLEVLERNDARLYPTTRNAMKLLMLTFVRTSELINAKWEEIDIENAVWNIPAERMKMKRPHVVPLSRQVIEILKKQKNVTAHWEHVFPSPVRPKQPMSNNTILGALEGMGYKGRMTGHGFRALAMSSIKEQLNYRHEVIDLQLAHAKKNKIDAAYDRAEFLDERTEMMQEWADLVDSLYAKNTVVHARFR